MAVTITDVAKRAGCSITTVSRAFSAPHMLRPDTLARIQNAAKDLEYEPNAIARAMVTQRSGSIAFVIGSKHYPIMQNPFYADIAQAAQIEAEQRGYHLFITSTEAAVREQNLLLHKRIDGVLLAGQADPALLDRLSAQRLPVVLLNNRIDGFASITADDYRGAALAVEHLLSRGHTRIGLLEGDLFSYVMQSRRRAYEDVLRAHGLAPLTPLHAAQATPQAAMACVAQMLDAPDRPTALFCMNDRLAIGAMKAALRRGLRIPDSLAVVGFDGSNLCTIIEPELTSVAVDTITMGKQGAQTLIGLIEGKPPAQDALVLAPMLMRRDST